MGSMTITMKKIILAFFFTCYFLLFTSAPVAAKVITSEETITISAGEVVNDDLYVGGPIVNVAGIVNGDLYAGAGTVNVSGEVKGDILAGGGMITVSGKVTGSVRSGGGQVSINNAEIGGSVSVFGGSISINKDTKIGGGVLLGAGAADVDAEIARGIVGGAGTLAIGGKVGKEIKVAVDTFTIKKTAEIAGDISYTSENEIEVAQDAKVSGKVSQVVPEKPELSKGLSGVAGRMGLGFRVWAFFAALLLGSILIYLFPRSTEAISLRILQTPWQSFTLGFLVSILIWPAFILLMITGVGAPLGIILLGIFILGLYFTKIFIGLLFGRSLFEFLGKKGVSAYLTLTLGLIVYYLLTALPIIGPFVLLAAFLFGIGSLFIFAREAFTTLRQEDSTKRLS